MAEEAQKTEAPPKKKLPIKTIGIVLGLLIAEAVGVVMVVSMWSGPAKVQGKGIAPEEDSLEQTSEVLIVGDRFPNHHTGRVWIWDTEIQVKVKQKHLEYTERVLEERAAEIKTGVSQIFRTAHHNHLTEPNLETLTRQLTEYLRGVFGHDADGNQRVMNVLVPKCVGFPADF